MPIYSENEAEREDRLASLFAGAAATASLAASAAASLKEHPDAQLAPRLSSALSAMVRVVERVAALDVSAHVHEMAGDAPFPEELVAKLVQSPIDQQHASTAASERLNTLLADLRGLLDSPTVDAAARVEEFLGALSQAENAQAQALARGSLELELFVGSPLTY